MSIVKIARECSIKSALVAHEIQSNLEDIVITSLEGVLSCNEDFTKASVYVGDTVHITGTLEVKDCTFEMPISRNNSVEAIFLATVVEGVFTVDVNFAASGQYVFSNEEANLDLDVQKYNVNLVNINVIKKV